MSTPEKPVVEPLSAEEDPETAEYTDPNEAWKRAADVANQAFMLADPFRKDDGEPLTFALREQEPGETLRAALAERNALADDEQAAFEDAERLRSALTRLIGDADSIVALDTGERGGEWNTALTMLDYSSREARAALEADSQETER